MFKSLFKKTDRVGHLHAELRELVDILESAQQAPGWAERARDAMAISDEALLCQRVQSWLGGMGSLNDLILQDQERQQCLEKTVGNLWRWSNTPEIRRLKKQRIQSRGQRRKARIQSLTAKEAEDVVVQRAAEGFAVHRIGCISEPQMMADFAEALQWETQFGYTPDTLNLDALHDALSGVPNEETPRVALIFENFADLEKRSSARATSLICLLEDHAAMAAAAGFTLELFRSQAKA